MRRPVGVVLAGGLSSRMGSDKAMLTIDGRSLLQYQIDLLTPLCTKVLVSGDYAGFDCVPDALPRCGPLGGLYSVAMHCPDAALLILSVDALHITSVQLERLILCANACYFSGQPLPAFFPNSMKVVTAIQQLFAMPEPDFSLRALHRALCSKVLVDANFSPLNINTAADWHKFVQNKYK